MKCHGEADLYPDDAWLPTMGIAIATGMSSNFGFAASRIQPLARGKQSLRIMAFVVNSAISLKRAMAPAPDNARVG